MSDAVDGVLRGISPDDVLNDLRELEAMSPVDVAEADFASLQAAIEGGPLAPRLPGPSQTWEALPSPSSKNGSTVIHLPEHTIELPNRYIAMANYLGATFGASLSEECLWQRLLNAITDFFRWILGRKQSAASQLKTILATADEYYAELRKRVRQLRLKFAGDDTLELVFLTPDLFVYQCRLLADPAVPHEYKIEVALALIYLASPIDFIPEGIIDHPIAYLDDVAVALYVLERGFDSGAVGPGTLKKHWPGELESLDRFKEWYRAAEKVLGPNPIRIIFEFLRKRGAEASAV